MSADSLFTPADTWAQKHGIEGRTVGDSFLVRCPKCQQGELRIHSQNLWFYCWCETRPCWARGEGERALTELFEPQKRD